MPMDSCPLLGGTDQSQAKNGSLYLEVRTLQEIFARFKSIGVDPGEFACLKAISLFKPGKHLLYDISEKLSLFVFVLFTDDHMYLKHTYRRYSSHSINLSIPFRLRI